MSYTQFIKKIKSMYNNKSSITDDAIIMYIKNDEFLSFLTSVLFIDYNPPESIFTSLDYRIVIYFIKRFMKLKIEYKSTFYDKTHASELFNFCLIVERKHSKIVKIAPDFFARIISDISVDQLKESLKHQNRLTGMIRLLIEIRSDMQYTGIMRDYHILCVSRSMKYLERLEFMTQNKIDAKRLYKYAAKADEILLTEIMNIYPEFYAETPIIKPDRLLYFADPSMLQNYHHIKCISVAYSHFITNCLQISDSKYARNMNILFKMIIIENHIYRNTNKFCKVVLQSFIIDMPEILMIMLHRMFDMGLIDDVIANTPAFYGAFDIALGLYAGSREVFYFEVLRSLIAKYPTLANYKKILNNNKIFDNDFITEIEEIVSQQP